MNDQTCTQSSRLKRFQCKRGVQELSVPRGLPRLSFLKNVISKYLAPQQEYQCSTSYHLISL